MSGIHHAVCGGGEGCGFSEPVFDVSNVPHKYPTEPTDYGAIRVLCPECGRPMPIESEADQLARALSEREECNG